MQPITIHGKSGVLVAYAAGGDVDLEIREKADGPALAKVTFDPTAPVPLAIGHVFQQARRHRREQQARIARAMKVLLGDTTDIDGLLHRLQRLVETGHIDVDLQVEEDTERPLAAATSPATAPVAGPEYSWRSEDCESDRVEPHQDCDGCSCECHTP